MNECFKRGMGSGKLNCKRLFFGKILCSLIYWNGVENETSLIVFLIKIIGF